MTVVFETEEAADSLVVKELEFKLSVIKDDCCLLLKVVSNNVVL